MKEAPDRSGERSLRSIGILNCCDPVAGLRRSLVRVVACLAMVAGLAPIVAPVAEAQTKEVRKVANAVPPPRPVINRVKPLKQSRTTLARFDSAPFPFHGKVPGTDRAFLDVEEEERLGHRTRSGVLWEDEVFADDRVLLHIPKGYDVRRPGVMVVFFHGHGATLERDVLIRQQVAAQITSSGVNAVLVAPQFAVDAANSSPGKFWEPAGFGRFLGEAASRLARLHGDKRTIRDFTTLPIVIVGYSGGYYPTAWVAEFGGLTNRIRGIVLLDALYGELERFVRWMSRDRSVFFISSHTSSTAGRHAELQRLLEEQGIAVATALPAKIEPGGVFVLPGASTTNHRDFVTHAWVAGPIGDVLRRSMLAAKR